MLSLYTILKPKRNVYYDVKILNSMKDINLNDNNDITNYLVIMNCNKGCKVNSINGDSNKIV